MYFGLPFCLAIRTQFAPAWTIDVYLDYISLSCPVGYCSLETDHVCTWITLCLAYTIPVVVVDPCLFLTTSLNKALHMDPHASFVDSVTISDQLFSLGKIIINRSIFTINQMHFSCHKISHCLHSD